MTYVIAVDFGATSVRVCRVDLDRRPYEVEVVRRHTHHPMPSTSGPRRWDWDRLLAEVDRGLDEAVARGPVASIAIDTWGVDYGLLDGRGRLVAPPVSYRDRRTDGWRSVVERIGPDALWARTGIQLQPFNTIFQLATHDRAELSQARHLLMLPELVVHHLTGTITGERTSAGTSALVDIVTGCWSDDLAAAIDLDPVLLPPIQAPGTPVGTWRGVPVHLVGGHDTASAVVAMGADPAPGAAFVSSGTWLLVGQERDAPDLGASARAANLSNEIGATGGYRLLANLAGWWLVEGCRTAWQDDQPAADVSIDRLLHDASAIEPGPGFDPTDARFLSPDDMLAEVTAAAGLPRTAAPAAVTRAIIDAMAVGTEAVLGILGGAPELHVFGGGAAAALHVERLAERCGVPARIGPVEATALGNALVQGIAIGRFGDLAEARAGLDQASTPASTA